MGILAYSPPRSTGQSDQRYKKISFATYAGLLVVLFIFFILAVLNSLSVPLSQGEDELAHYRYISFIAQKGRLPIDYAERKQAWYRADWPPLYHLLVAWAVSPFDTSRPHLKDVGESPRRRLVGEIFYPRLIIYTEDVNWPWQDGILAWHLGRFISILFAAGALVFTYLTMLELSDLLLSALALPWPISQPWLATLTTAVLALSPRFLFTSAMLGDDSLFILLSAAFIWLLSRAVRGDDRWRLYAVMGLLLGLSITTKYSTGLLPLVIVPLAWWRAHRTGWRWLQSLGRVALAWSFTLIGASWWFGWIGYHFNTIAEDGLFFGLLRPLLASGPDVSMHRIFALFSGSAFSGPERPAAIAPGSFWDWLVYLFQTFWGVPVLERDPFFPWVYILMLIGCLLAVVGLVSLWRRMSAEGRMGLSLLVMIVALLLPFPILRYFLTHNVLETGQGRHLLYPAAQAIPILLVFGWLTFIRQVTGTAAYKTTGLEAAATHHNASRFLFYTFSLPALLLLWSVFQLAYMARTYPEPLPVQTTTFQPAAVPQPFKYKFGPDIQLLGYDFKLEAAEATAYLTLFWRSLQPVEENYRTQVQLVGSDGRLYLTWLSHPLNGRYPTRAWDKGDVVRDTLPLPVAGLPAQTYTIQLNLLYEAGDSPLLAKPARLKQFELPASLPLPHVATLGQDMNSGGEPWLLAYHLRLDISPARYRQTLPLAWSWQQAARSGQDQVRWTLLGPDNVARPPVATGVASAIFMVGADWPSGDYRLQVARASLSDQTAPLLTVANEARLFELPSVPANYTPVEATFAGPAGRPEVKLLGYALPTRRAEPGGGLPLTLYWQSLAPVLGDYIVFDVLLDENQQLYGGYDRLPREYYSTILWAEGEIVTDGFAVPISPQAPAGVYSLHIGLYSLATGSPVSLPLIQDNQVTTATSISIGPIKVGGPPVGVTTQNPAPQVVLNHAFGDRLTLLGYDLVAPSHPAQDPEAGPPSLKLTLYWRAEGPLQTDYTTFLHLRNAANENVAQKDRPPANGRYPTSLWDAGEIIVDEIVLSLENVPPGQYTPVVGLYDLVTGTRLPVAGVPENEFRLESVTLP